MAVRTQLERILASDEFQNAPSLGKILRYVVEETLAGRAEDIKEYTLGAAILERGPDFDPRIDPIVRVQARRLRAKLDRYYARNGAGDSIRITFPKGSYVPAFEEQQTQAAAAGSESITSLVVLPLQNATTKPELEYFCDGLTEDLIHALTRNEDLRVVARMSAFAYKGQSLDVRTIGERLGVAHVLEGTLRDAATGIRVSIELVSARDGFQLWSRHFDGTERDLLKLRHEVSASISGLISPQSQSSSPVSPVGVLDAFQLYLKGRYAWRQRTAESIRAAAQLFEQARGVDSSCALAAAGLADCFALAGIHGVYPPRWVLPKAKDMASRALELDETLGEAYASLGMVLASYDWDYPKANEAFARALACNPGYSTARHWLGVLYHVPLGHFEDAVDELERAIEYDPLSSVLRADLACSLMLAGRSSAALECCDRGLAIDPLCVRSHWVRGFLLENQQRFEEAAEAYQRCGTLSGQGLQTPLVGSALGYIAAMKGDVTEADAHLRRLLELSKQRYVAAYSIALVYLGLGEHDKTMRWLEEGYNQRCGGMNWLAVDPRWRPLQGDPRFRALLGRLNLNAPPLP